VHTSAKACLSWVSVVSRWHNNIILLWQCLLLHALHCSVAQCSRLTPLSLSPNSDESGKQSLYPDGDPDHHQNLIICSSAHCQPSLQILCQSIQKFFCAKLLTNRQTNNNENITFLGRGENSKNFPSPTLLFTNMFKHDFTVQRRNQTCKLQNSNYLYQSCNI